jgi:hypothetical protein
MNEGWVVVFRSEDPFEASLVKSKLEDAGIPVLEKGEALGKIYGFTLGPLSVIEILVPVSLKEEAWEVISQEEEGL